MTVATRSGPTAAPRAGAAAVRLTRRRLDMALGVIWLLGGALQFQPHMFTRAFFTETLGMANGRGAAFALVAGLAQVANGLAALFGGQRAARYALAGGIVLAVTYGVPGQDLGGLATGQATDPGTAPLLVLLALALWPRRYRQPGTVSPARAGACM